MAHSLLLHFIVVSESIRSCKKESIFWIRQPAELKAGLLRIWSQHLFIPSEPEREDETIVLQRLWRLNCFMLSVLSLSCLDTWTAVSSLVAWKQNVSALFFVELLTFEPTRRGCEGSSRCCSGPACTRQSLADRCTSTRTLGAVTLGFRSGPVAEWWGESWHPSASLMRRKPHTESEFTL